jgi:hypothetical protein
MRPFPGKVDESRPCVARELGFDPRAKAGRGASRPSPATLPTAASFLGETDAIGAIGDQDGASEYRDVVRMLVVHKWNPLYAYSRKLYGSLHDTS